MDDYQHHVTYQVIAKNCKMQKMIASPFLCHYEEKGKQLRECLQLQSVNHRIMGSSTSLWSQQCW